MGQVFIRSSFLRIKTAIRWPIAAQDAGFASCCSNSTATACMRPWSLAPLTDPKFLEQLAQIPEKAR